MKPVRCLIIDDERLVRQHLRRLVKKRADIEIVGEASSKATALRMIEKLRPDLLLLDIQMPGGSGFDLLNALPDPPYVIFITAYDRYAVRAFDVNALDYLLKPIEPERFDKAMAHAERRINERKNTTDSPVSRLAADDVALVPVGASGHFVRVDQILFIESEGNYTRVTTDEGRHFTGRQTMKQWVDRLPAELFAQLDRGLLINTRGIRSADFSGGSATITLSETEPPMRLGAAATARLRQLLSS